MKNILLIGFVMSTAWVHAQIIQKGTVLEQNSGKQPVSGVQIIFTGAPPTDSDNLGVFSLVFPNKKEGTPLNYEEISKNGYELVNETEIQSSILTTQRSLQIVICRAGLLSESRLKYYKISKKTITEGYERKLAEMSRQKITWQQEKDSLNTLFEQQLKDANRLAEQFSRTNFDDVSDLYKEAFGMFQNGKIDSALLMLEQAGLIDRADKRIQERKAIENLQTSVTQRRDENEQGIQHDMQAIKLQSEMYTMKFEYKKAEPLYEKLLLLDTTNVENLILVANFYQSRKKYNRSLQLGNRILKLATTLNWQKANTYGNIGEIYQETGQFESALAAYENFEIIYKNLVKQEPENLVYKNNFAVSYDNLGRIYRAQGDFAKALEYFQKGTVIAEELYSENSYNERFKNGLATFYSHLGDIYKGRDDLNKALNYYLKDLKLSEELCFNNPLMEDFKNNLAVTFERIGDIYWIQGEIDSAVANFQRELKLFEEIYRENLSNESNKVGLATSYERLGDIFKKRGALDAALECFLKETNLFEEAYHANPNNENNKDGLATSYSKLGSIYQEQGDSVKSLIYFQKGLTLTEELYINNPRSESLKHKLKISFDEICLFYQIQGNYSKAIEYLQKDLKLSEELYRDNPRIESLKDELATSYSKLGFLYQAQGEFANALAYFHKYTKLGEELYRENSGKERIKTELSFSYTNLGDIYKLQGNLDLALVNFQKGLKFAEELFRENPDNVNFYKNLGNSYFKLAGGYALLDNQKQALLYYQKSGEIYLRLADSIPDDRYRQMYNQYIKPEIDQLQSGDYRVYKKIEKLETSIQNTTDYMKKIENEKEIILLLKQLLSKNINDNQLTYQYLYAKGNLSWFLLFERRFAEAESFATEALNMGDEKGFAEYIEWIYTNLASSLLLQGKYEAAKKIYIEKKNLKYPLDETKTFKEAFLHDLDVLKKAGITNPDVEKIQILLAK